MRRYTVKEIENKQYVENIKYNILNIMMKIKYYY